MIVINRQSFLIPKRFILRINNYRVIDWSIWVLLNIFIGSSWYCRRKKQFSFHCNLQVFFLIFFLNWLQMSMLISFCLICCTIKILFCNVAWLGDWSFLWSHSVVLLRCNCFLFDILKWGKGGMHLLNLVILSLYTFHLAPLNGSLVHLLLL